MPGLLTLALRKVSRRIVACFVLAAVVPTLALTVYAYHSVSSGMADEMRHYLRREARTLSLGVFDRLLLLRRALEHGLDQASDDVLSSASGITAAPGLQIMELVPPRGFSRLMLMRRMSGGTGDDWQPTVSPLLRAAQEVEIRSDGGIVLASVAMPSAPYGHVYMGRVIEKGDRSRTLAIAEVDRDAFWEHLSDEILGSLKVAVCDGRGQLLFASGSLPSELALAAGLDVPEAAETPSGESAQQWYVESRHLFVTAEFGAPEWTFHIGEAAGIEGTPIGDFRTVFPLGIGLTLAIVAFLAIHLVRRILDPLKRLGGGASALMRGELDTRITVDSGDEFEQLAGTFNQMADRLSRHIQLLETASRIDRHILSTFDVDEIAHHLLEGISSFVGVRRSAMLIPETEGSERLRIHCHSTEKEVRCEKAKFRTVTSDVRRWLAGLPFGVRKTARLSIPEALRRSLGLQGSEVVEIPARFEGELVAVMILEDADEEAGLDRFEDLDRLVAQCSIAMHNARLVQRVQRASSETLEALARAVDATSNWTAGHSRRVTNLAMSLGKKLGLHARQLDRLYRAGMLHDIGKLGVSADILDKPGRLTDEEFAEIRRHPSLGASILRPLTSFQDIAPIVRHHHEKYDGSGYPDGLQGTEICLEARILALTDVFDALASERPYRPAMPLDKVTSIIEEGSGTHFDPSLVPPFLELVRSHELPSIGEKNGTLVEQSTEQEVPVNAEAR